MSNQPSPIDRARGTITGYMDQINGLFSSEVKVSVVVRAPGNPDVWLCLTDDTVEGILEVIGKARDEGGVEL